MTEQQRVVWKYEIPQLAPNAYGEFTLALPRQWQIIHIGVQDQRPHLWIRHPLPPTDDDILVTFHIVGTGHEHSQDLVPSGSYFAGDFVWHVMWEQDFRSKQA